VCGLPGGRGGHNAGIAWGKHSRSNERGSTVRRLPDGTIEIRHPTSAIEI
jgi:hypothetical protein